MINLQDLERAFAPITDIGHEELTFEASGRSLTIRQVLPDEEVEVNKYARVVLDETGPDSSDSDKEASLQRFLDRFKIGILCNAIVEIDGMDLRGMDFISTGEVLDNGIEQRVTKFKAMEKIIAPWTRHVLNAVFAKYGELSTRIELKAEKVITFNPTDLDAEIERVETRLAELKQAKKEQGKGPTDPLAEKVKSVTNIEQTANDLNSRVADAKASLTRPPVTSNSSQVPPQQPGDEPPVVVTSAPSRTSEEAPVSLPPTKVDSGSAPPVVPAPTPGRRHTAIPAVASSPGIDERALRLEKERETVLKEQENSFESIYDSMADPSDPDVLAAEAARLAQARAAKAAPPPTVENVPHDVRHQAMAASRERSRQEATGGIRARKKPPHLAAAEASLDTGVGDVRSSTSQPLGKLGGVEAYRMPASEVSRRTTPPGVTASENPLVDAPTDQSVNHKFQPGNPRLRKVTPKKRRKR